MHFTIDKNPKIDGRVVSDLTHIVEAVERAVPEENFISIFLVGGFGRGEGGMIMRDGLLRPANDYDLELITRYPVEGRLLKELGDGLASELGIPWVHIESHILSQLRRMKFTMYNYDLKYAGFHLEGDNGVLNLIPQMEAGSMPWREAENLMFTRLWCFIGAFRMEMLTRSLTPEESFFLANQISKSLLAIQDTYLILSGLYHPSYIRRIENLEKTRIPKECLLLCKWAAEFKLRPGKSEMPALMDLFFRVKDYYLATLRHLYSTVYNRQIPDWDHYARLHFNNYYTLAKRLYFFFVKRSRWYADFLNYNLGMVYLVSALNREEISKDALARANYFFRRTTGYRQPRPLEWTSLQNEALKLRETIWR